MCLSQFGHNDARKDDTSRFADARTDYKKNLLRFVADTRAKGGIPILLTPVNRRQFDDHGNLVDTHGDYPIVVRELAMEEKVALIDLHRKSMQWLTTLGPDDSKKEFVWIKPDLYTANRAGRRDDTHFNELGALKIARLVAEGLRELNLPLSKLVKPLEESTMVGLRQDRLSGRVLQQ